ncbi:MAG: hypothetical protein KC415_21850 [Anaerolineales bacterium]|nr:hypothetical protein [Anaerolineales bacterium]MCB8983680.1 hypothetical protein [Ardenticatenaceae bacterium]
MTFFFLFNFLAFFIGIVTWNRGKWTRRLLVAGLTLYICFGYYFLHKI